MPQKCCSETCISVRASGSRRIAWSSVAAVSTMLKLFPQRSGNYTDGRYVAADEVANVGEIALDDEQTTRGPVDGVKIFHKLELAKYTSIYNILLVILTMPFEKEKRAFSRSGGLLRTSAALRAGIHPRTLYDMRDEGVVEQLSRGLYRLADLPALSNPDLVTVAGKIPSGVVCLISALAYHEITTQIPHEVHIALPRGTEPPRLKHPPLRVFWFKGRSLTEGVETHKVDGSRLRV